MNHHRWKKTYTLPPSAGPNDWGDVQYVQEVRWACSKCGVTAFFLHDSYKPNKKTLRSQGIMMDCNHQAVAEVMDS